MGTIIRIAVAFHTGNLGVILPAADLFHPKTVRASKGSLFRIKIQLFQSFENYRSIFERHQIFPFMLHANTTLRLENFPKVELFTLVFGNEATGLDEEKFCKIGTSLRIPQSELVDSLNISVAAGIGAFIFTNRNGLI
ncbi:RNA methyltransferase [Bacillaceae bacterium Marseille-Q3522]|nr:RNA methyltransferase [Bacillaceae bacterium Marseille-Q3522]